MVGRTITPYPIIEKLPGQVRPGLADLRHQFILVNRDPETRIGQQGAMPSLDRR